LMDLKIGVCGIACERCPRMMMNACPSGKEGCVPKENEFCAIATCAYEKKVKLCFECEAFPCERTRSGPISFEYCRYISGKGE